MIIDRHCERLALPAGREAIQLMFYPTKIASLRLTLFAQGKLLRNDGYGNVFLMQVVTKEFIKGKKVLLRYDIDVALKKGERGKGKGESQIAEDFKLRAGLSTLKLCLENASKVIIIGHLGRPEGKMIPELSVEPIREWLEQALVHLRGESKVSSGAHLGGVETVDFALSLEQAAKSTSKLILLENIRFFHGEVEGDADFAHKLASLGEVYVNEAFSSYNSAASTTMVPTLLPHVAGIHFAEEVRVLREIRDNPKKPFVVIMGGAKVEDKLPVINALAQKADAVLVGGKLAAEIKEQNLSLPKNVMVGKLNEEGTDIAPETVESWKGLISQAEMIVWNGPLGRIEENTWKVSKDFTFQVEELGSAKGSYEIAKMVLGSRAATVVGGGDTVAFLGSLGVLGEFEKKGLVSVGGGAMLKFLAEGTLPTIEALK